MLSGPSTTGITSSCWRQATRRVLVDHARRKHARNAIAPDGHLVLAVMADGGVYEFEPVRNPNDRPDVESSPWRVPPAAR